MTPFHISSVVKLFDNDLKLQSDSNVNFFPVYVNLLMIVDHCIIVFDIMLYHPLIGPLSEYTGASCD